MSLSFRYVRILFVLTASVLITDSLAAQSGTTSLRGTVVDKTGAAVVGAKVRLGNRTQGFERDVSSGPSGEYEFLALQPGQYEFSIEMAGFSKYERHGVQLLVNTPLTLNVTLEVGSTTETVEVSAQAQTINTADASLGNAFNENQVKQLPLEGRNVPDLLTLQAGVVYTGNRSDIDKGVDTRSGAVNGARSDQSNVTLDGVDVNDQVNGNAFRARHQLGSR